MIHLPVHVRQSRCTRARARQRVRLAGRQPRSNATRLPQPRSGHAQPLAILVACAGPSRPGPASAAAARSAAACFRLSAARCAIPDRSSLRRRGVALRELAVVQRRGLVARRGRQVPSAGTASVQRPRRCAPWRPAGAAGRSAREGRGVVMTPLPPPSARSHRSLPDPRPPPPDRRRRRSGRCRNRTGPRPRASCPDRPGSDGVGLSRGDRGFPLVALGPPVCGFHSSDCPSRSSIGSLPENRQSARSTDRSRGLGSALSDEDGQKVADLTFMRDRVGQRKIGLHRTAIAPALALAGYIAGIRQLGTMRCAARSVISTASPISRSRTPGSWPTQTSTRAWLVRKFQLAAVFADIPVTRSKTCSSSLVDDGTKKRWHVELQLRNAQANISPERQRAAEFAAIVESSQDAILGEGP